MRALVLKAHGRDGLELVDDAPVPRLTHGEVLVRVIATSVNPVDVKTRNGTVSGGGPALPSILGWDMAGVVVDQGDSGFAVGDRVVAMSLQLAAGVGTWADLVALPASVLAAAPYSLSLAEAATLPLPGLTAWQSVEALGPAPGARVLVVGAVGAVGGLGLQIAAARGIAVDGLVSRAAQADVARSLGAGRVFTDLAEVPPGHYDAVLDTAGIDASAALKDGARYLTVATENPAPTGLDARGIELVRSQVHESGADLAAVVELVDHGEVRPRVAQVAPVQDYVRVLDDFEAGRRDGAKPVLLF